MRRGAMGGTGRERRAEPARRLLGIAVIQCLPAEDRRRVRIERIELGDAGPRLCRTARLPAPWARSPASCGIRARGPSPRVAAGTSSMAWFQALYAPALAPACARSSP